MLNKPIAISVSPNVQNDDFLISLKTLLNPRSWKHGIEVEKVEGWFKRYFKSEDAVSFNSGRSALMAILYAFGIGFGDEVIIQSFTCVAVPDPIIWSKAKPIYVDVDKSLNIDPSSLEKAISKKTKAIIVQHTFGIGAKIDIIKNIAQKYNLILIEDCAHALGGEYNNLKLGTFGDASFFSFGRDKIISSVFGGMAIINGKWKSENGKLREYQEQLNYSGYFWIFQQLLHPIFFTIILPFFNFKIAKLLIYLFQKLRLLSLPVSYIEKQAGKPSNFPARYPNALATLLLHQLGKLDIYNNRRKKIAMFYARNLDLSRIELPEGNVGSVYLRYNILVEDASKIYRKAKMEGILLGNWYREIVDPKGVNYSKIGYQKGSCPKAEEYSIKSLNLPTYPDLTDDDIRRVISLINRNGHKRN